MSIRLKIYSHRFFGIGLYHLKSRKVIKGVIAFVRGFKYGPVIFIKHAFKYISMRLFGIKKDYKKVIE